MRRFAASLWLFAVACSVSAASPEWARPYIKEEAPIAGYIGDKEPWILLFHDEEVQALQGGGLTRQYREVYALSGSAAKRLVVTIPYNPEIQRLATPEVWVPGVFGYKQLNLKKASMDLPDVPYDMITSEREVFISTTEIEPRSKAVVTWTVSDTTAWPGQDIVFPFGAYPCEKWRLHAAGTLPLNIVLVDPRKDPPEVKTGDVELGELPSFGHVWQENDPWAPDAMEALPYIMVTAGAANGLDWERAAAGVAKLFSDASSGQPQDEVRKKADALIHGAVSPAEKAARIEAFVQGLTYREIAWGRGAFTPESPAETLRTLSADCKGKVVLMQALLQAIGIDSVPVLCRGGGHYLGRIPVPTTLPFDHVTIAVDIKGQGDLPAALTGGPGDGWILVDPTDPLAVFGLASERLQDTPGLWLSAKGGGLFNIRFSGKGPGFKARLEIDLGDTGEAAFTLTLHGDGGLVSQLAALRELGDSPERLKEKCLKYYGWAASGLEIEDARFEPENGSTVAPVTMVVRGKVPQPFQPVSADSRLVAFAMPLLGRALGLPRDGYSRKDLRSESERKVGERYAAEKNYECAERQVSAELSIKLPPGLALKALPALKAPISAKWLGVTLTTGQEWALDAAFHRGEFPKGSETARLSDLNALCALFRQPLLLEAADK